MPVKAWTCGLAVEDEARRQLRNVAGLPFVFKHVAVMPDVHYGRGATVGSVIPTKGAIVPAAVGVDIGCGMMAARTNLVAGELPDGLSAIRREIEAAVPVGMASHKELPRGIEAVWRRKLFQRYCSLEQKHPAISGKVSAVQQIGTLGGGNHFIELCLDEEGGVWVMLHSGSRGIGNRIGTYFISKAREEMERISVHLPDRDLAYISEGSTMFDDYVEALGWAQDYAAENREAILHAVMGALRKHLPMIALTDVVVNCHHNYVERESHFGENVWVTRKGAVRAREDDLGIIPGSMGARSFIVRGKGNPESFMSCSHGAGRAMSRGEAKRRFTLADHKAATAGVECRKDAGVLDETPGAYKPIERVMAAQADLVKVVHELKQVLCVKG
ncbi:MAG TPA: RtcB family protein [Stellaceae bacterium]|nr:RtcB family protein [Stellaceae bacterium]